MQPSTPWPQNQIETPHTTHTHTHRSQRSMKSTNPIIHTFTRWSSNIHTSPTRFAPNHHAPQLTGDSGNTRNSVTNSLTTPAFPRHCLQASLIPPPNSSNHTSSSALQHAHMRFPKRLPEFHCPATAPVSVFVSVCVQIRARNPRNPSSPTPLCSTTETHPRPLRSVPHLPTLVSPRVPRPHRNCHAPLLDTPPATETILR